MEEQLIEATIKLLSTNLNNFMTKEWERQHIALTKLDENYPELEIPEFNENDFYRYSLDERISSKNYRFIIGCQREVFDSTNRGDALNSYNLEILYIHDFSFDNSSRYYIPLRVRSSVIKLIESHYRSITRNSSDITLTETAMAEESHKGSRSVLAGLSYKIIS